MHNFTYYFFLKYVNVVKQNMLLPLSYYATRSQSICLCFFKVASWWSERKVHLYFWPNLAYFICMAKNFFNNCVIWVHKELTYLLLNSTESHKRHETHDICLWLEFTRNLHKKFASVCVVEFYTKYLKLTKFGILVNKSMYQIPSMRDSNMFRACGKNFEISWGRGVVILRGWFVKSGGKGGS